MGIKFIFLCIRDYRAAVVEAVRVAGATKEDFKISSECNEKITAFQKVDNIAVCMYVHQLVALKQTHVLYITPNHIFTGYFLHVCKINYRRNIDIHHASVHFMLVHT